MWNIYDKTGNGIRCTIKALEYSGTWMGAGFVTSTIKSEEPIPFEIGDYLIYRGEKFEINYDPTALKKATRRTSGEAFVYDSVKFNNASDELTRCDFLDFVKHDNQVHFTSLPKFSFFASSVQDLADRVQVNLDRIYTGDKKWTVIVHPEHVNTTNVNIEIDNIKVWGAVELFNSKFGATLIIRGRTITVGTAGIAVDGIFTYGRGNGLYEIQRTADSDQNIITRLRAYGSSKNLPNRYYNKLTDSSLSNFLPNNMAVMNLMLPGFPEDTLDPYIDSENITELGVREASVYFDGTGELEEIHPSMQGMTAQQMIDAGISVSIDAGDNGNLDEVFSAEQLTDDGTMDDLEEGKEPPPFTITLKDIGFNINDYLIAETATISMTDGTCGGREFEITKCEKQGNKYVLTCNRVYDDGLKLYFPYNNYNIKSGDKFVLLQIDMPDVYIKAASQRLLVVAKEYLAKVDYVRYSYEPKVDDIFMARQHKEATERGEPSIHDTIKEGDFMMFEDADLGIDGSIIIDTLIIKEGEDMIPKYTITLRDEKVVGSLDKMQNQIDSISKGQGGGGLTTQQIQSIIQAFGSKKFLRKDQEDVAAKHISFEDGIDVKNGISTDSLTASNGADVKNGVTTDTLSASANVSSPAATISDKTTTLNLLVQAVADIYDLNVSHVATLFRTTIKDYISSELYTSGLTGSGMKLYKALNGDWNLELDNVVIRKAMTVFELIISKIRAVNGGLVISPANGKVKSVLLTNGIYRLEIEGDMMFVADDLVRCQTFTKTGSKYYWVRITSVSGAYVFVNATEFTTSLPTAGDDLVQFGNKTNALRQGIIYLTASEDGKPRISVLDGVNSTGLTGKTKVILGCLDGVVDSDFPADHQPSGYGLYAQNVFLKGLFVLRNGKSVESEIAATNDAVQTAQSAADAAQTSANNAKTEAEKVRTEYTSDFSVLSGKVESKVSQTDFNALGNRVSSAESSITQLPNQIALSVTESKQYTDGKVDSVQVGGRNLVEDSAKTIVSSTKYYMSKTSQQLKGKTITVSFEYEYENVSTGTAFNSFRFGFEWALQKPDGSYYLLNNWVWLPESSSGLNESGRAITTFTVPSDHTNTLSTAPIYIQVAGGTVRVWNFKIEEGNKPTDWSPAPEDVDAEIATAKTAATNAQTTANQAKTDASTAQTAANNAKTEAEKVRTEYQSDFSVLSGKVESKVSQTDFNALGNRVSSAESSITQLPNQIALSVTESKQYTDGKVDAVQVGGRNLIIRSSEEVGTWVSLPGDIETSANHSTTDYIKVEPSHTYSLSKIPSVLVTEGIGGYWRYAWYDEDKVYISRRAETSLHNLQWTIPSNAHYVRLSYPIDSQPKFEKGNKATDWSPAPEDVDAEINKRPTTDQIKAEFTIDPTGISMLGKKIALTGMVTFTALDASAQATINSKVTGNDIATKLGYSNYTDMINKAAAGQTIINGGYIRTSLIDADSLITNTLLATKIAATDITTKRLTVDEGCKVGGFSIGSGRIGISASPEVIGNSGMFLYSSMVGFNSTNRQALIGTYHINGLNNLGQFIDRTSDDLPNYGITFDISNPNNRGRNFAFLGKGNGVLNGFVYGYEHNEINFTAANQASEIERITNVVMVYSNYANWAVVLPRYDTVCDALGIGFNTKFQVQITVLCTDAVSKGRLFGRSTSGMTGISGNQYPEVHDCDNNIKDGSYDFWAGDSFQIVLIGNNTGNTSVPTSGSNYRAYIVNTQN